MNAAFVLLALLVFLLPWEKTVVVPGLGTLARIVGLLAAGAGAWEVYRSRQLRPLNVLLVAAAAFVGWSCLTWLWSIDRAATAARSVTYLQLLVMLWLIWQFCRTGGQQLVLIGAYVAGACVASGFTILRYATGVQTYWRRYAAPGFDPNDLGIAVAIAIPLALYLGLRRYGIARVAVVLAGAAILLTASRTSLIAAAVALVFGLVTQRWWGIAFAVLLALGAFLLAPKESRERIATTKTEITQGTLHQRTQIWKAGVKAFRRAPIAGAGAGAYPDAVEPLIGRPGRAGHEYVAHNVFLSVLVETGIAGFALYALMLGCACLFVWVMPSPERTLWATVLLVWAIGASTLTWEHRKPSWLILGLAMTEWARSFPVERRR